MIKIEYRDKSLLVTWKKRVAKVSAYISDAVSHKYLGTSFKRVTKKELFSIYTKLTDFEKTVIDDTIGIKNWKSKLRSKDLVSIPSNIIDESSYNFLVYLNKDSQKEFQSLLNVEPSKLIEKIDSIEKQSGGVLQTDRLSKPESRSRLFYVLEDIFVKNGYLKLSNTQEFYNATSIEVCPYCNHVLIGPKSKDKKDYSTGQLDHFYCKELYPYLALTLSNLVPSCGGCNGTGKGKGQDDMLRKDAVNPYTLPHSHGIDFSIDLSGAASVSKWTELADATNIHIRFVIPKLSNNDTVFGLQNLYRTKGIKEKAIIAHKKALEYAKKPYKAYVDRTLGKGGIVVTVDDQFLTNLQISRRESEFSLCPDSCFMMSIFMNSYKTATGRRMNHLT